MKKLNRKGFTLIELLAVITIMGILMVVAIPAISRTIENTRRDSFLDTAKQYANGVKTLWLSDSLECHEEYGGSTYALASGLDNGAYFVKIDSSKTDGIGSGTEYPIILESGGKSSWGNKNVKGYVKIEVTGAGTGNVKQKFSLKLADGTHGITDNTIEYSSLKRGNVVVSGATYDSVSLDGVTVRLCREV